MTAHPTPDTEAPVRAHSSSTPSPPGVTVRLFAAAREAAGAATIEVAAESITDLCTELTRAHGSRLRQVLAASSLLIDGERVTPQSNRPLAAGAVVDVLPPFAGG